MQFIIIIISVTFIVGYIQCTTFIDKLYNIYNGSNITISTIDDIVSYAYDSS